MIINILKIKSGPEYAVINNLLYRIGDDRHTKKKNSL